MKKEFIVYDMKCDVCNYKFNIESTKANKGKWSPYNGYNDERIVDFKCPNCGEDVFWKSEYRDVKAKDFEMPKSRVENKGGIDIEKDNWGTLFVWSLVIVFTLALVKVLI